MSRVSIQSSRKYLLSAIQDSTIVKEFAAKTVAIDIVGRLKGAKIVFA